MKIAKDYNLVGIDRDTTIIDGDNTVIQDGDFGVYAESLNNITIKNFLNIILIQIIIFDKIYMVQFMPGKYI
jgi:hypothetical protein